MMSVAVYQVYIEQQNGIPVLLGDVTDNQVNVAQAGLAVIDITALPPYSFAEPALTWQLGGGASRPLSCGWGPVAPTASGPIQEIAINVANGAPGTFPCNLNLAGSPAIPVPLTVVTALG